MKVVLNEEDDFLTRVLIVSGKCERFKLKTLSEDQFKSLIFICSLQCEKFADIRIWLLHRHDQNPTLALKKVAKELSTINKPQTRYQPNSFAGQNRFDVLAVKRKVRPDSKN